MAEPFSAERTAGLLLWFLSDPSRFGAETRRRDGAYLDNEVILKLALGRRIHFSDASLNAPDKIDALKEAAEQYVQRVFFHPDATPYQVLGVPPDASAAAVKESFRLLMQLVHPDRQEAAGTWPDAFAAAATRAYSTLRNPESRAAYDQTPEGIAARERLNARAATSATSPIPAVTAARAEGRIGRRARRLLFLLPEWSKRTVGGFARTHPAVTVFALLFVGATLFVAGSVRERPEALLVREARDLSPPATTLVPRTAVAGEQARAEISAAAQRETGAPPEETAANGRPRPLARSSKSARDTATTAWNDRTSTTTAAVRAPAAPPLARTAVAKPSIEVQASSSPVHVASLPVAGSAATPLPNAPLADRSGTAPVEIAPRLIDAAATSTISPPRPELLATASAGAPPLAPATAEIEALFAEFVENYERGRLDAFAALFDADADTNLLHGRAAIRSEYDELFSLTQWRRIQLSRMNWRRVGDTAFAKGELSVRIGWRDGREVYQRVAVDMELARRDGRAVITRLKHEARNP